MGTIQHLVNWLALNCSGFTLIFARLSDGIGRRNTLFLSWLLFGAFSTAGGLAKSLNSLIGLRVLQGVGGSGLYTMTFVIGNQVTPIKLLGVFGGAIGAMTAIGSVLGNACSIQFPFRALKLLRTYSWGSNYPKIHMAMGVPLQRALCHSRADSMHVMHTSCRWSGIFSVTILFYLG